MNEVADGISPTASRLASTLAKPSRRRRALVLLAVTMALVPLASCQSHVEAQVLNRPAVLIAATVPLVPMIAVKGQIEDHVLNRQLIMQQLDDDAEMLGMILSRAMPASKLAETARSLAKGAKDAYESFKPNAPGGSAKPEVWANWADYSQRMEDFVANSDKMAKAAETGDIYAVTELVVDAMPCKSCHDVYRQKKPS